MFTLRCPLPVCFKLRHMHAGPNALSISGQCKVDKVIDVASFKCIIVLYFNIKVPW